MRWFARSMAVFLTLTFALSPLGAATEGYVCATSGKRMNRTIASCKRCQSVEQVSAETARAAEQAALSRPCCIYVRTAALPPVWTAPAPGMPSPDVAHGAVLPPALVPAGTDLALVTAQSAGRDTGPDPSGRSTSEILSNFLRL
jgi:hypothetical protein